MVTLAEYFRENRYQSVYEIGDRVFGRWNDIPFIGTVGTDSVVSEDEGPRITLTLDLPLAHGGKIYNFLVVKHDNIIQKLIQY